jgi:hypothetical protein
LGLKEQWDRWCELGARLMENMVQGSDGNYAVEVSEKNSCIGLKYQTGVEGLGAFITFLKQTFENCGKLKGSEGKVKTEGACTNSNTESKSRMYSEMSELNESSELEMMLERIQKSYVNNSLLMKNKQELQSKIYVLTSCLEKANLTIQQSSVEKEHLEAQHLQLNK